MYPPNYNFTLLSTLCLPILMTVHTVYVSCSFSVMPIAHFFIYIICSQTPLHSAAEFNQYSIAFTLLKYGASAHLAEKFGMSISCDL